MNRTPLRRPLSLGRSGLLGACCLLALAGCASSGDNSITGFDQVTVKPGDTAQCQSNPCRVLLEIPAGTGSFAVRGTASPMGTYPAGQTADLGNLYDSQALTIVGMDVPKTYVYVPNIR